MRTNILTGLILLLVISVIFSGCDQSPRKQDSAESKQTSGPTVFFGGNILTMEGSAPRYVESIVEENGLIAFAGTKKEALAEFTNHPKMIDLEGKTLMPSFIDPHSHFMSAVRMVEQVNVASPPMGDSENIPTILKKLQAFKDEKNIQDGQWIVGWGYDQDLLEEKRHITKTDIDAQFPNNKVLIIHVSMHGAVLNSPALDWAGIDATTETPEGGIIARMPHSNEPAGLLMEMAYLPVFGALPQPDEEALIQAMTPAQMMYASNGYTQAVEGFTHVKDMDVLKKAAAAGILFIDIVSLPGFNEMDAWLNNPQYEFGKYSHHLKFGGGKFTLDGSPQGRTAYMTSPYLQGGPSGEENWFGNTSIPREDLARMARIMTENNIQINFHANGDGAIEDAIYAIEKAGILAGQDRRPIIIHSQFQKPEHLPQYVKLGISPTYFTNHVFYWGDVHIGNVGLEKASFISPLKAAHDLGIVTSNHTDFNVTTLDPFFIIWTAVKRETRSGEILGPDQRVSIYSALQDLTTGPAYQFFEEERKGKLKAGLLADFVILDTNPIGIENIDDIKSIKILETIKEGKTIFSR